MYILIEPAVFEFYRSFFRSIAYINLKHFMLYSTRASKHFFQKLRKFTDRLIVMASVHFNLKVA